TTARSSASARHSRPAIAAERSSSSTRSAWRARPGVRARSLPTATGRASGSPSRLPTSRPRCSWASPPPAMGPRRANTPSALVKRLVIERRISVLFTEHSMDVVFAYADRIIVLARGVVIADGSAEAIRDNAHVQQVYLGTGRTFTPAAQARP